SQNFPSLTISFQVLLDESTLTCPAFSTIGASFITKEAIIITKNRAVPIILKVVEIPYFSIRELATGASIIAPDPKPAAVRPPAIPFLSGNHFTPALVAAP